MRRREEDVPEEEPARKKLNPGGPEIVRVLETPHPSFTFDIQLGGFAIDGSALCRLEGVLFFPRINKEKTSFALAIADPAPYAWIERTDEDLRSALEKTGIKAVVLPKMKLWDGAQGLHLINFYGSDFPWMEGSETDPQVSTFTESTTAQHGTPILILARIGKKTTTTTAKTGEVVVSWPLYVQGIRVHPRPPKELLELKNSTKPAVAFPSFP